MTGAVRQPPGDLLEIVGVVADHQPAGVRAAGPEAVRSDVDGRVAVDPPDGVVGVREPVRVLQRDLGLADAAHPVQHHGYRAGQRVGAAVRAEVGAQPPQLALPPGEVRIARG
jgi:hypothetical protein